MERVPIPDYRDTDVPPTVKQCTSFTSRSQVHTELTRIYSIWRQLDVMRKRIFLTKSTIFILSFLYIGFPSLADELSLQQVIEAVNFTIMSIEAAELRANLYVSPRPIPKSLQEKIEVDLQHFKIQYQNSSNPVVKKTFAQHIKTAEDILNSPPLPRYYEYTVIFRRNEIKDGNGRIERLIPPYNYRIFRVNWGSKHADPQFLKSLPPIVRGAYTGQEFQTKISNGESEVILTVNDRLDNSSYFDEPSAGLVTLLFRGASVVNPIKPERVIDFHRVTQNGITLYSIELTYDTPRFPLTGVDKFRSTRLLVNPLKGFSIVRREHFLHVGGKNVLKTATQFDNFKLYAQAIWYPNSIQYTEFKEDQAVVEHLFEIHEAEFNISIPPDFFHVQENAIRRLGIDIPPNSRPLIP